MKSLPRSLFLLAAAGLPAQAPAGGESAPFDVTGRVVTWDRQPIAGARVAIGEAGRPTTSELLRSDGTTSAADGTFTLRCPARGSVHEPHWLLVAAKGHASCQTALPVAGPQGVAVASPRPIGDVMLPPGQRIVGRVRDAVGQPVADAAVLATDLLAELLQDGSGFDFVCTTRTSAGGIFDLPCALPAGSALQVEADGFFTAWRRPVAAGTPLEFELQKSGWIEGHVHDEGGKGVAGAWVLVQYEADPGVQQVRADAQGAFRAPLRHPGRWRARAQGDGKDGRTGVAPLGEGPATGLVIATAAMAAPPAAKKLRVQATTKGTGAAVRTFRAVAGWGDMVTNGRPWLQHVLRSQVAAAKPSPDGTVEVDGPADDGQAGAVYVVAEGHAPLLQLDVAWDEQNPKLAVELEPEASVRGVVRDGATGKPLAGARIRVLPEAGGPWGHYGPQSPDADGVVHSAADGTFRVGELGEGEWQVVVAVDGRPVAPPQVVSLQAGEAKADLVVDVPVGARVAGRIVGGPVGPGYRVSLAPVPVGAPSPFLAVAFDDVMGVDSSPAMPGGKPLAGDGSFLLEGLPLGHYTLLVHVPSPPRAGGALFLAVDSFRLREGGLQRDFDVTGDRVREIRGRVTFSGAGGAFDNLLVVAEPSYGHGWMHGGYEMAQGMRAFVGRDGAFAIPVVAGSYRLTVVDLQLGAAVATSKAVEVKDADVTRDVDVPLVQVTVECKPASGAPMALVDRLEVRSVLAGQREAGMTLDVDDSYDFGRGIRLPRGATSVTLLLPHGDVVLLARNHAGRLRRDDEGAPMQALGKLELQVPGDKKAVVTLEVGPPPEIPDEAKAGTGQGR